MRSDGNWSASDPSATGYSYQWLACSPGCSPISGATGTSFVATGAQLGDRIELQVTASNSLGSTHADSAGLGPITAVPAPSTATTAMPTLPTSA
jgi:hypothetical protein